MGKTRKGQRSSSSGATIAQGIAHGQNTEVPSAETFRSPRPAAQRPDWHSGRQSLRFRFPRNLSFVLRPAGTEPDEVVDYLKLFITTQPMDFDSLLQESVRSEIPDFRGRALGKLLHDVLAGGSAMRSVVSQLAPLHEWATEIRGRSHRASAKVRLSSCFQLGFSNISTSVAARTPSPNLLRVWSGGS